MKAIRAKLKSRAGESLSEVLVALLIAALALTILASMISASARMILDSRERLEKYYSAENETVTTAEAAVTVDSKTFSFENIELHTNKLGNKDVYSYVSGGGGS